jgi:4'-phosphopantetheinyl transferase
MHGVHIWRASLVRPPDEVAALHDLLDPVERSRAGRFNHERDRRRFIVARATLRKLLGERTATAPRNVPLCVLPGGKPAFTRENAIEGLHFNVSHSGDLALFVFADSEVGIDVERIAPHGDMGRVAAHFFSPDERAAFERLPEAERARFFFRTWVRKEAYLKATGAGLALDPAKVSVGHGYSVHDVDDIDDHVAAVALRTTVGI